MSDLIPAGWARRGQRPGRGALTRMLPLLRRAGRSTQPAHRAFTRPLPPPPLAALPPALSQQHPCRHRWLSSTPAAPAAPGARALKMSARAAKKLEKARQYLLDEGYAERTADSIIATLEKTPGMSASVSMLRSMGKPGLHSLVVAVEEEVAALDAKHAGKAKVSIRVSIHSPRAVRALQAPLPVLAGTELTLRCCCKRHSSGCRAARRHQGRLHLSL